MEENSSLFSLSIDPVTKANLAETAKWARFLAIVGFVFLGIMVLGAIFFISTLESMGMAEDQTGLFGAATAGAALMYIIGAAVAFFPLLYTFRFASQMRDALNSNDQALLNASFQNLKGCYRFLGIVTMIWLVLFALTFIFGIVGTTLS